MERQILKWATLAQNELHCFKDLGETVKLVYKMGEIGLMKYTELSEERGVVAYVIAPDFRGNFICSELFIYIKPEYRSIKAFNEVIHIMEQAAKENSCKFVSIGANIGYRDDKLLKILSHYGYEPDTVKKEI